MVSSPHLFLITGPAGSGKTTVARIIENHYVNVSVLNFSDSLKTFCEEGLELPKGYFQEEYNKQQTLVQFPSGRSMTGRRILQKFGDAVRNVDQDFFVRQTIERIDKDFRSGKYCVVPDLRYPNELELVKKNLGIFLTLLYIDRENLHNIPEKHPSESHFERFREESDFTINNNGSFSDLREEVIRTCKKIY